MIKKCFYIPKLKDQVIFITETNRDQGKDIVEHLAKLEVKIALVDAWNYYEAKEVAEKVYKHLKDL